MEEAIKITFFNNIQKGKLLGTFGIYIKALDIYFTDMKLLVTNDGETFIAPPSRTYTCERTGQDKFQNFWWFGKESNIRFQKTCTDAINSYFEKNPNKDPRKVKLEESLQNYQEAIPATEPEPDLPF